MNDIRKVSFAFTGLFALMAMSAATPAFADDGVCLQWDVSGTWDVIQSDGTRVKMKLEQSGMALDRTQSPLSCCPSFQ